MEHVWIKDLPLYQGSQIEGVYLVKERTHGITKTGDPFVGLTLGDKTGDVDAKLWGCTPDKLTFATKDNVIWIRSEVSMYKDKPQLKILELAQKDREVDSSIFLDRAIRDPDEMFLELKEKLSSIEEPFLRALLEAFLTDQEFLGELKEAPGSKALHHSYLGGLLEHTLQVVNLADIVATLYPFLHKELLLTCAFLHDLGKLKELTWRPFSIAYTDEGRLLGHIVLGAEMVGQKIKAIPYFPEGLRITIKHIILSHHGMLEFGSPKKPKNLEAVALNLVDDLDAKLNAVKAFVEKDQAQGNWTEYHRLFERFFLKLPLYGTNNLQGEDLIQDLNGE